MNAQLCERKEEKVRPVLAVKLTFLFFFAFFFSSVSLGKWTYKSPVFLGENQEFSIFWPKNRAFFPITTGTYKSISLDCWSSRRHHYAYFQVDFSYPCSIQ